MGAYHVRLYKQEIHHAVPRVNIVNKSWLRWLTLFTTGSTLLCCALPVLLVSLGLGSVVASMNYNIPGLFWLAQHKYWTLVLSGLLLSFLAWIIWRQNQSCPSNPDLAQYCKTSKKWNKRIFWISAIIWCIGVFFSLVLLPLRNLLGV